MKILLSHSDSKLLDRESIDIWRVIRPFKELAKHVDWEIDHVEYLIPTELFNSDNRANAEEIAREVEKLGQYDIIWTSYFPDAVLFDTMLFVQAKFGTKFVLDVDDDFYNIPMSNPVWKAKDANKNIQEIQYIIESTPYLITSCPNLYNSYSKIRTLEDLRTFTFPNLIGDYSHKPFDNGKDVVIAYAGGISHTKDLENTGFLEALRLLMKKYPQVRAGSVGIELKKLTGTLRKRYQFIPGKPGNAWTEELFPAINADIYVAPLENTEFNRKKTNIKWLESAYIPAVFVGSKTPPYSLTVINDKTGVLVRDGVEFWYSALERLILNKTLREQIAQNALKEIEEKWTIKNKWHFLKEIVEEIYASDNLAPQ